MMPGMKKPEGRISPWLRRDKQVFGLPVPYTDEPVRIGEKKEVAVKTVAGLFMDTFTKDINDLDFLPVAMHYEVVDDCSIEYRLELDNGTMTEAVRLNGTIQIENDPYAVRAGFFVRIDA